jgi:hypothetical protein
MVLIELGKMTKAGGEFVRPSASKECVEENVHVDLLRGRATASAASWLL